MRGFAVISAVAPDNNLSNALKFSLAAARVNVDVLRRGILVGIGVTDRGPGFSPDGRVRLV